MKKKLFFLSCLLAPSLHAQFEINPGLSGSWHDPNTDGQGLQIDVVEDQSNLFAAWFTFSDEEPEIGAVDRQRWYTMFGPYVNNTAQMTLFRATDGQLDRPLPVNNEEAGQASLVFHSCSSATFEYVIGEPPLSGSIDLERLTPDVFCQTIEGQSPTSTPNYPPVVEGVSLTQNGDVLTIGYSVEDPENDLMDIQVEIIGADNQRYSVPVAYLDGDAAYPVSGGASKTIQWRFAQNRAFVARDWQQIEVVVIADDRFVSNMQDIVDLVSTERLVRDVEFMQGVRHHMGGLQNLVDTRNYIRNEMSERGVMVETQVFDWLGFQGENIIGIQPGRQDNNSYYAIDGHYDTIMSTPGADDNASGAAGMLEAMRVLSQFNSEISLRYIGFDMEELGLIGARHYVSVLPPGENVLGLINLEMIGYTCRGEPECVNFPNADTAIYNIRSSFATALSDAFVNVGETHVPELKITSVFDDGDTNFRRSDHAPFWDIGVDALMISDGANFRTPHYHQASDVIDHFDLPFMTQVVKTAVGALATVAGVSHTGRARSDSITLN